MAAICSRCVHGDEVAVGRTEYREAVDVGQVRQKVAHDLRREVVGEHAESGADGRLRIWAARKERESDAGLIRDVLLLEERLVPARRKDLVVRSRSCGRKIGKVL